MKRLLSLFIALIMTVSLCACGSGEKVTDFYNKVTESQDLLDAVADAIYSNWYDAIYEDEFGEDINTAIYMAQLDHTDDLERIEELDAEISDLFKEIKDTEQGALIKDIMSAYSDYYEFVVNVSGSFNSYSADKETLKKELASLLKDLSYEI
ncbi:MAG: hypothetical protein E7534_01015 [Ruminococcaceae bacterium]|nr:hypothetical protein [Oscillospiraceae bacterium]